VKYIRSRYNQIQTMKNSRIRYRKERIGHNYKEIIVIEQTAGQRMLFYKEFFLNDISNTLRQFPVLNLIIPESPVGRFLFHKA